MEVRTLRELVRFDAEKKQKIPIFDSPQLYYDLYTLLPGQRQRPFAFKRSDKIVYVLEGVLRASVDGESADLAAGQALRVPAGAVNSLENAGDEPVVALVVVAPHPECAKRRKKRPDPGPGAG
ncbi:cupin domain-containing protein [Oceanithermus sp.]|uniref:cupin domain-containing protein n=1 Tax=Oceanithermus sp. TaxID=2268145 RepID=UPI00257A15C2|nr:cupin domain-containing protein [Oceanithermus sp.]